MINLHFKMVNGEEKRKSLTRQILEHLMICAPTIMISALFVPYGRGLGRTIREIERSAEHCPHDFSGHSQETVSATLSRMKKRKLVFISGPNKKAIWRITANGKRHFKKAGKGFELPPEDGKTRVVVFDVPENRNVGRNWLRAQLLACDFTPLQKSVFIGTRPLPERLLEELKGKGLFSYVRIMGLEYE